MIRVTLLAFLRLRLAGCDADAWDCWACRVDPVKIGRGTVPVPEAGSDAIGVVEAEGGEEKTMVGLEIGASGTGSVDLMGFGTVEGGDSGKAEESAGLIVLDEVSSDALETMGRFRCFQVYLQSPSLILTCTEVIVKAGT